MDRLFRFLEWFGAISLFFVMALTVVDVFGRYLLNSPLPGSIELTRVGIAVVVFCALPSITARRGHVSVDLFEKRMTQSFVSTCDRIFLLLFAAGLFAIAWRMYQLGVRSASRGAVTEYLHIPFAAVEYFIAFMTGVTAVAALAHAFMPLEGKKPEYMD